MTIRKPSVIVLDIETSPIIGYAWRTWDTNLLGIIQPSQIMSVAWKELGEDKSFCKILPDYPGYKGGKLDDKKLVKEVWDVLDKADVVVAHHGRKFDLPKLNSRFIFHGLPAPSSYKILDTKAAASKYFAFDSNSLNNLGHYFGVGEKIENGGFSLWEKCMGGDLDAWELMRSYNCLTPNHKLLGSDLKWKPISDFKVGDKILGFDEDGNHRRFKESEILMLAYDYKPVYKVTLESGHFFEVTGDHKWLVVNPVHDRVGGFKWKTTEDLFLNGKSLSGKTTKSKYDTEIIPKLFDLWEEDLTKDAGWLAGMFDGEGCLCNVKGRNGGFTLGICQKEGPELDKINSLVSHYSLGGHYQSPINRGTGKHIVRQITVRGNVAQRLHFLGTIRPERLISKVTFNNLGRMEARIGKEKIVNIEQAGVKKIAVLGTSTRTFVADGYPMHNCQDVLLLEKVYYKLRPYIANHPNLALIAGDVEEHACPSCQSHNVQKRGLATTRTGTRQRFQCKDCGSWSTGSFKRNSTVLSVADA